MGNKEYALDTMDEGVLIINADRRIIYANTYARSIFLLTDEETISFIEGLSDLRHSNDELVDLIIESIMTKEPHSGRLIHFTNKNDEKFALFTACTAMEGREFVFTFSNQTDLERENEKRRDSTAVLTCFFLIACLWTVGVSIWMRTGQIFDVGYLTIIMELMGLAALFILMRKTSLRIKDFGLSIENIVPTLKRTAIRVGILFVAFCIVKLAVMKFAPSYFPVGVPFWDWNQVDFRLIKYLFTALLQEFLARGGVQTSLARAFDGKYGRTMSIWLTSLYFMSLHFQYGLPMMLGAGVLSIILGYMYKKDGNIYGVTVIHYCFGKFADFLRLI